MKFDVILASASPRRKQLLEEAGVTFTVRTPVTPVDESLEPDLQADPPEAAKKLAERKAGAIMWAVRIAVARQGVTPGGATEVMEVLGKEEALGRIDLALEELNR